MLAALASAENVGRSLVTRIDGLLLSDERDFAQLSGVAIPDHDLPPFRRTCAEDDDDRFSRSRARMSRILSRVARTRASRQRSVLGGDVERWARGYPPGLVKAGGSV
jgi:hypothetical protein